MIYKSQFFLVLAVSPETEVYIPGHSCQTTKDDTSVGWQSSEADERYGRPQFHAREVDVHEVLMRITVSVSPGIWRPSNSQP